MIEADHKKWAKFVFQRYLKHILRKNFHSIRIIGELPAVDDNLPLIIAPNHSSWWDGFFVYLFNMYHFKRKFYLMMLEQQLSKYPFFSKLGAFSINQNSIPAIIKSLAYASNIMKNKENLLVIYPQGKLQPTWEQPLKTYNGLSRVIMNSDQKINLLFLGMHIEMQNQRLPFAYFKFSNNLIVTQNDDLTSDNFDKILSSLLHDIKQTIVSNNGYTDFFNKSTKPGE